MIKTESLKTIPQGKLTQKASLHKLLCRMKDELQNLLNEISSIFIPKSVKHFTRGENLSYEHRHKNHRQINSQSNLTLHKKYIL